MNVSCFELSHPASLFDKLLYSHLLDLRSRLPETLPVFLTFTSLFSSCHSRRECLSKTLILCRGGSLIGVYIPYSIISILNLIEQRTDAQQVGCVKLTILGRQNQQVGQFPPTVWSRRRISGKRKSY